MSGAKWVATYDRLPPVGVKVECRHESASDSYNCIGEVDANRRWHCPNGFVFAVGKQPMIAFDPTHWRALESEQVPA